MGSKRAGKVRRSSGDDWVTDEATDAPAAQSGDGSNGPNRPAARPSGASVHWAIGRSERKAVPRASLGVWQPPDDRPDPVAILESQNADRMADLVPLRFERMSASAFAFYRGAAAIMAADLGTRPRTTLQVQLAGDAHLANFGGFATPERTMVFDLNDFDETLPGPFEWDVQRLVASFAVAARHRGMTAAEGSRLVATVARTYCDAMASFARMGRLSVWYARIQAQDIVTRWGADLPASRVEAFQRRIEKGQRKTSSRAVSRYSRVGEDGQLQLVSQPPFVVPLDELLAGSSQVEVRALADQIMADYAATLPDDRQQLLRGYRPVDVARKVVGVGSVGTRCWITLMVATDDDGDDIVLQLKEAGPSVLESVAAGSQYANHGQRVVEGQRLMQAASDLLLGWTRAQGPDGHERDYYVRQMWDWKTTVDLETIDTETLGIYAHLCGWTLARAHARTGDRHALSAYLGSGGRFIQAMQEFAESYADQNERDFRELLAAIASGRIQTSGGTTDTPW